jgi:alpha-tubulin suppressor-like RCC1 family protein
VHNCAILDDSTLWCWGSNEESRLGTAEFSLGPIVATPTQVGIANDYFHASGGQGHTCALRRPGALWCWGRNSSAQLGLGTLEPGQATTPLRAGSDDDWAALTSAQEGSCGRKRDQRIFCWGNNTAGRIGAGPEISLSPLEVGNGTYTSIATSTFHTCAVKTDGTLWCWGRNVEGQLAIGNYDVVSGPTRSLGSGFVEVGVGRFHTCALDAGGSLFCAGKNDVGQLGLGDTERRAEMTRVPLGG